MVCFLRGNRKRISGFLKVVREISNRGMFMFLFSGSRERWRNRRTGANVVREAKEQCFPISGDPLLFRNFRYPFLQVINCHNSLEKLPTTIINSVKVLKFHSWFLIGSSSLHRFHQLLPSLLLFFFWNYHLRKESESSRKIENLSYRKKQYDSISFSKENYPRTDVDLPLKCFNDFRKSQLLIS